MRKVVLLCCIFILIVCGCSAKNNDNKLISYVEAKEKIINDGAILIDVRSAEEYDSDHIAGAVNLNVENINEDSAKDIISSLDSYIIVYCQSGVRSAEAKKRLLDLGYNNVYDLGSIDNWKE